MVHERADKGSAENRRRKKSYNSTGVMGLGWGTSAGGQDQVGRPPWLKGVSVRWTGACIRGMGCSAPLHPGELVRWSGAGEPRMQDSPLGGEGNYRAISIS